jgi:hypothetical protein
LRAAGRSSAPAWTTPSMTCSPTWPSPSSTG